MSGSIWGFVKFEKNFTDTTQLRYENSNDMSSEDLNESVVKASLDMSSNLWSFY